MWILWISVANAGHIRLGRCGYTVNIVLISGRLVQDPETRYTQTGKAITTFAIAVNRYISGKEETDYIPVVTWERLAETCGNNLVKGRMVVVEGRLSYRRYEDQHGQKRVYFEVVADQVEFGGSGQSGQNKYNFRQMRQDEDFGPDGWPVGFGR